MEDVDFREQLKARDVKFLFVPKASVIHPWRSFAPDDKYLKMRLVSHALFFERYPLMRPSFYKTFRTILRGWILGLFMEAPRLKFRGFWRYLSRQWTLTLCQFLNWSGFRRKETR
jgi:GT2 family glycosyltransferase